MKTKIVVNEKVTISLTKNKK